MTVSAAKTPASVAGRRTAGRRGVVRATDCSASGLPSLHHQVARGRVHPHVGQFLPGRLNGGLPRALVQLFLTALRDLAALDFGARRRATVTSMTLCVPVGPKAWRAA
jgi:hypothetical protein